MSDPKRLSGRVQRHILEALEAERGAIVTTRSLAISVYGRDGEPEVACIRNAVLRLRKSRPDLDIRGFNGGRGSAGGYQLRVEGASISLVGMSFPDMLRELRERDSLTKTALASLSGVDTSYISLLESGAKSMPSRRIANAIASAFRLEPADRDRFLIAAGFWPWKLRPMTVEQIINAVRRRIPQEKAS